MDKFLVAGKNNSRPHLWGTSNLLGEVIEAIAIANNSSGNWYYMPNLAIMRVRKHKKLLQLH
ncbi:MAG TPA: hypothetical protein DCK76_03335 [Desulfotomaculum sp.]|nr:hypothetical protein [Desulfotomaculum sp.]HBY04012.1 hypothetical protein [Desulfotomaculum sp.]